MSNFQRKLIVAIIISISVILSITSSWNDSIIVDEVPHIGAGYSYLVTGDMRLNPEHPPLAKDLAALPLTVLNLNQDAFKSRFWQTDLNGQWEFGRLLIFNSGNDADLIKHLTRLPMLLFFILSTILIFKWTRKLYGDAGAITALVLFSFSPTIIAHSRFVTTDTPALFGVLLGTYFFLKYLRKQTRKNLLIAGLVLGVALITKFSTFLLVPFFVFLALIYGFINTTITTDERWLITKIKQSTKTTLSSILIIVIAFLVVVWPVYYFHTVNYPVENQYHDTRELLESYGNRTFADPIVWASGQPVIRGIAHYGLGLLRATQRAIGGNTTYFLGDVSRTAWSKYFPIVYFIKEPLPWWGLVVLAILMLGWQLKNVAKESISRGHHFIRNHPDEFTMLLWLAVYWTVSIKGNLNIGVRHLLPIYPFTIILVSGQLARLSEMARAKSRQIFNSFLVVFAVLIGWYIFESINIYPYYLTYFNQVAGGPSGGYNYVVDSNLDWGQDLIRFSKWVEENKIPKIEFDYFGWADASYYLHDKYIWATATKFKDDIDFKKRNQSDGWLAVSASFLQGSQGSPEQPNPINYLWLKSYKPVTVIGNSIFVYRIK